MYLYMLKYKIFKILKDIYKNFHEKSKDKSLNKYLRNCVNNYKDFKERIFTNLKKLI